MKLTININFEEQVVDTIVCLDSIKLTEPLANLFPFLLTDNQKDLNSFFKTILFGLEHKNFFYAMTSFNRLLRGHFSRTLSPNVSEITYSYNPTLEKEFEKLTKGISTSFVIDFPLLLFLNCVKTNLKIKESITSDIKKEKYFNNFFLDRLDRNISICLIYSDCYNISEETNIKYGNSKIYEKTFGKIYKNIFYNSDYDSENDEKIFDIRNIQNDQSRIDYFDNEIEILSSYEDNAFNKDCLKIIKRLIA